MKRVTSKENLMNILTRTLLLCIICLITVTAADAQRRGNRSQRVDPIGTFSNMEFSPESGDVGGTQITVLLSFAGDREQYFVVMQDAQGVPGDPEMVRATVRGATIEFTINSIRYTGTITTAGIRLRSSEGYSGFLRRRNCR
jgi:hypothetical protein